MLSAGRAFATRGDLEAVRNYLLQFGSQVVVEGPADLAAWMRAEADRMLTGHGPI